MEYVGQRNIKKLCNFYVSDLHLSVMLLPYLSKQINEDVEITTIFEKLEKQNIEAVLEKLNIKNKDEILNIDWLNRNINTEDEIKKTIKEKIEKENNNIIIIGGSKKFISENNENLERILLEESEKNSNIKIIDCYNVEEVGTDMKDIVKCYNGVLNTAGENRIIE